MALVDFEIHGAVALLTIDSPPVNALTRAVRGALLERLSQAETEPSVVATVIRGANESFIAGADINELDRGLEPPHTPDVVAAIEQATKPVVAAISGHALGGGLELALACAGRVVSESSSLGFPEVKLGLIPGAGGTQLLPRLVGVEQALDLMLSGRAIGAAEAAALGIVDATVPSHELLDVALAHARALADAHERPRQLRDGAVTVPDVGYFDRYRRSISSRTRGQIAPAAIIRSVENAVRKPFDEALRAERELFLECLASPQSRAMRYAFFAERAARKFTPVVGTRERPEIDRVAVVGAGTMGTEIAFCFLRAGCDVILHDTDSTALERARRRIGVLADAAVTKRRITREQHQATRTRLRTTSDLGDVAAADLVVEAVFEQLTLKEAIFRELDRICRAGALLATNTSTLDVDSIAAATQRPRDVVGLHFFSPASVMRLIEIVRGARTSEQALARAQAIAKRLGKLGVPVGNAPGFVGNRMFHAYAREAGSLLLEGAEPRDVDRVLETWGMAMGPHAVSDLAGLDVGYKIRREQPMHAHDPSYFRVADYLVEAGRLGQKSGAGLYRYEPGSRVAHADPRVTAIIAREAAALGIDRREITAKEIVDRCICALVLEGVRILERGVAKRASDIDAIWLNGYGFPRFRGGPMYHADALGLTNVLACLRNLERRFGPRYWKPPELLDALVATGAQLSSYEAA